MSKRKTYFELLQHPKWQEKRLEILKLAGFSCENCGNKEETLHVHHTYYEKGLKPWDYPVASLRSLCATCHQTAQDRMVLMNRAIGVLDSGQLDALYGYALASSADDYPDAPIDVFSYEVAMGVASYWNVYPDDVLDALEGTVIDGRKLLALKIRRQNQ